MSILYCLSTYEINPCLHNIYLHTGISTDDWTEYSQSVREDTGLERILLNVTIVEVARVWLIFLNSDDDL